MCELDLLYLLVRIRYGPETDRARLAASLTTLINGPTPDGLAHVESVVIDPLPEPFGGQVRHEVVTNDLALSSDERWAIMRAAVGGPGDPAQMRTVLVRDHVVVVYPAPGGGHRAVILRADTLPTPVPPEPGHSPADAT